MNAERAKEIGDQIGRQFADSLRGTVFFRGELTLVVDRGKVLDALGYLGDTAGLDFNFPVDIAGVDYLESPAKDFPERFAVVYHLLSWKSEERIRVKAPVAELDAVCPSAVGLWPLANWAEREIFDMFGIHFTGHPDLRRILMWEEFEDYPLRKDYPLQGRGERDAYPVVEDDFPEAARSRREPSAREQEFEDTVRRNGGQ